MIAISRVRGIGVALIDSTSTVVRSRFICSLCSTPKRCSSSTTIRPRSLTRMSGLSSRWVPITMSTVPSRSPSPTSRASLSVWKRLSDADGHREAAHPLGERRVVLLHEQRRRHQDGDLLAVLDRLERRPDRDLGLAVADVAADQPVHRDGPPHVGLDLLDRGQLVGGLVEREGVLELALPRGVGPERVALGGLARGVELDQLGGDLADRLAGAALALGPVGAAEPVEAGLLAADVAGDLVEAVGRHEEPVGRPAALGGAVLEDEVLAGGALHLALPHLHEAADAVLLVDDVVAGLELERVDLLLAPGRHPASGRGSALRWPERSSPVSRTRPTASSTKPWASVPRGHRDEPGLEGCVVRWLDEPGGDVVLAEHLDHPLGRAVAGVDDDDPVRPSASQPRRSATARSRSPR